jgi:hypothetical protein
VLQESIMVGGERDGKQLPQLIAVKLLHPVRFYGKCSERRRGQILTDRQVARRHRPADPARYASHSGTDSRRISDHDTSASCRTRDGL